MWLKIVYDRGYKKVIRIVDISKLKDIKITENTICFDIEPIPIKCIKEIEPLESPLPQFLIDLVREKKEKGEKG